jgi:hypothetical protein
MKQHIFTKVGVLLAFMSVFLSFFACRQDVFTVAPKGASSAIIAKEAQQWFESQNFADAKSINLQPQWEDASVYGSRVEIPILLEGKRVGKSLVRDDTNYMSKTRLIIYKKNATEYDSYILYFAPSKNFKGKVNAVNTNNYAGKKFDGEIFIASLGNKIIGKYKIINGERGKYGQLVEPSRDGVKLRDWECVYESDYLCSEGWGTEKDPLTGQWMFVKKWICEPAMVERCYWVSGGDPCDFPNPPSWCDTFDPCNQPVPPPSCSTGDPCDGPNPPLYCSGGGDDHTIDYDISDDVYICANNFNFTSVGNGLKQLATISGVNALITSTRPINLPTTYFQFDFNGVTGVSILSTQDAAECAAGALNSGESHMRSYYRNHRSASNEELIAEWQLGIDIYFETHAGGPCGTGFAANYSIMPDYPVTATTYNPSTQCN